MPDTIAERYRRFAFNEVRGQSPLYEALAAHVSKSDSLLAFLGALPVDRQQPNLFFAAVRCVGGLPPDGRALDEVVEQHAGAIANIMRSRTTQTNEPGRCAVLLPVTFTPPATARNLGGRSGSWIVPVARSLWIRLWPLPDCAS